MVELKEAGWTKSAEKPVDQFLNKDIKGIFHLVDKYRSGEVSRTLRGKQLYKLFKNGFGYPFSEHRPSGLWLSKSRNVCLRVRVSVCSLLRYRLNVFLPPLPEVGYPIFLEIWNPWGKEIERIGLRLEHFCLEVVLNRQKKSFFLLILPYKTRWKPRFPMD